MKLFNEKATNTNSEYYDEKERSCDPEYNWPNLTLEHLVSFILCVQDVVSHFIVTYLGILFIWPQGTWYSVYLTPGHLEFCLSNPRHQVFQFIWPLGTWFSVYLTPRHLVFCLYDPRAPGIPNIYPPGTWYSLYLTPGTWYSVYLTPGHLEFCLSNPGYSVYLTPGHLVFLISNPQAPDILYILPRVPVILFIRPPGTWYSICAATWGTPWV